EPLEGGSATAQRRADGSRRVRLSSRLDRYLLARTLGGVGSALAVIAAVIILVQFVDLSRQVGVRADIGPGQLFGLTMLRAPSVIPILLPFVFLFGVIAAYVGLHRKSELG